MTMRVAQVRLVGAVFPHRLAIGNQREFRSHRLAAGKILEHAAHDRLDRIAKTSSWVTKLISTSSW
jgi:hypothetical protein